MDYVRDIPPRTLAEHIAKLKRDRGDPRAEVKEGQELDAARAIERRSLAMLAREQLALERKQKSGEALTNAECSRLRMIGNAARELGRPRDRKDPNKQGAATTERPSTWLEKLAAENGSGEAGPDELEPVVSETPPIEREDGEREAGEADTQRDIEADIEAPNIEEAGTVPHARIPAAT